MCVFARVPVRLRLRVCVKCLRRTDDDTTTIPQSMKKKCTNERFYLDKVNVNLPTENESGRERESSRFGCFAIRY